VRFDERAGFGELSLVAEEARAVQVDVGEVERHRAALGDLLGLVEGRAGRAADEPESRRPFTAPATCAIPLGRAHPCMVRPLERVARFRALRFRAPYPTGARLRACAAGRSPLLYGNFTNTSHITGQVNVT
jgi:hypothetical protein